MTRWGVPALVAVLGAAGPLIGLANGGFDVDTAGPLAAAALVAAAVLLAVWPRALPRSAPGLLSVAALGLLAGLLALSSAWSPLVSAGWLLGTKALLYAAAFLLAAALVRARGGEWLLWGLLAGAVTLAAVTMIRLVRATDPSGQFFDERLSGPIGYHNGLAAILLAGALVALYVGARPVEGPVGVAARGVAWGALGLLVAAALGSQSRGALLGALVGLIALAALLPWRLRLVPGVASAVAVAAVAGPAAERLKEAVGQSGAAAAAAADDWVRTVLILAAALVVPGVVYGLLEWRLRHHSGVALVARRAAVAACALAAIAIVAAGVARSDEIAERFEQPVSGVIDVRETAGQSRLLQVNSSGRIELWRSALGAIADEPLRGKGAGGFHIWWNTERESPRVDTLFAHSLPLEIGADTGIPGLALLAAWWAGLAWTVVRLARRTESSRAPAAALASVVALWIVASSLDWLLSLPAVTLPAVVAGGALVGMGERVRRPSRSRGHVAARWLTAAAALAGAILVTVPFMSDRLVDRAAARGLGDPAGTRALLDRAESLNPHDPRIDELRARLSYGLGEHRRARRELVEGTRRVPRLYGPWVRLADFDQFVLRDPRRARASLRTALRLHRGDPRLIERKEELEELLSAAAAPD